MQGPPHAPAGVPALRKPCDMWMTRCSVPFFLRNTFPGVPSQHFIDQGLIPDAAAARFFAELIEHSGIDSNRDQLPRCIAERRPADAPHGFQLRRG